MRRAGRALGTGTVLAVVLTACGSAEDGPTVRTRAEEPRPATCTGPRAEKGAAGIEPAVAQVDALAARRFAHVYTGLRVDAGAMTLDLYRIPDAAFDRAVCRATSADVTVRLHDTTAANTELEALKDRISEEQARWDGTFTIRVVDATEDGHVSVGVDKPEVAEPLLRKTYGDLVTTEYVDAPQLRRS